MYELVGFANANSVFFPNGNGKAEFKEGTALQVIPEKFCPHFTPLDSDIQAKFLPQMTIPPIISHGKNERLPVDIRFQRFFSVSFRCGMLFFMLLLSACASFWRYRFLYYRATVLMNAGPGYAQLLEDEDPDLVTHEVRAIDLLVVKEDSRCTANGGAGRPIAPAEFHGGALPCKISEVNFQNLLVFQVPRAKAGTMTGILQMRF